MTNINDKNNLQSQTDLSEQLRQISHQLEEMKTQLSQLPALSERVSQLEADLTLVTDLYRYERLRNALAAGDFSEADHETIRLIQEISGQPDLEELSPNDIKKFPCNGIRVIDQLWRSYSNNRFGFSVQLHIYQSLGGTLDATIEQNNQLVQRWGNHVGWRENNRWKKCEDLDFSLNAPVGCHPSRWWNSSYGSKMTNYFLSRLITCEL
jgi:flagellar biosynthesis chaperone FliJ